MFGKIIILGCFLNSKRCIFNKNIERKKTKVRPQQKKMEKNIGKKWHARHCNDRTKKIKKWLAHHLKPRTGKKIKKIMLVIQYVELTGKAASLQETLKIIGVDNGRSRTVFG